MPHCRNQVFSGRLFTQSTQGWNYSMCLNQLQHYSWYKCLILTTVTGRLAFRAVWFYVQMLHIHCTASKNLQKLSVSKILAGSTVTEFSAYPQLTFKILQVQILILQKHGISITPGPTRRPSFHFYKLWNTQMAIAFRKLNNSLAIIEC